MHNLDYNQLEERMLAHLIKDHGFVTKEEHEERLNEAYRQRGVVVVGLAALAMAKGYEVCRRESTETEWPVLYIELPQGQVSWHFNIKDDHMIERFPINNDKEWDGKFSGREVEFMLKALDY